MNAALRACLDAQVRAWVARHYPLRAEDIKRVQFPARASFEDCANALVIFKGYPRMPLVVPIQWDAAGLICYYWPAAWGEK